MGPFLSVESTTQCYRDCSRGPSGPKNLNNHFDKWKMVNAKAKNIKMKYATD